MRDSARAGVLVLLALGCAAPPPEEVAGEAEPDLDARERNLEARDGERVSGVLLWGEVGPGELVLHPAVQFESRARLPERAGPNRLRGLDEKGNVLFALEFEGLEAMSERPEGSRPSEGREHAGEGAAPAEASPRQFSYFLPLDSLELARLHRIELLTPGSTAVRESIVPPGASLKEEGPPPELEATAEESGSIRVTWNAEPYPLAVIRDGSTGSVLSMARGGDVRIPSEAAELEVLLSDGVKTRSEPRSVRR